MPTGADTYLKRVNTIRGRVSCTVGAGEAVPGPRGLTPTSKVTRLPPRLLLKKTSFGWSILRLESSFSTLIIFDGVFTEQSFLFIPTALLGVCVKDKELSGFSEETEILLTDL